MHPRRDESSQRAPFSQSASVAAYPARGVSQSQSQSVSKSSKSSTFRGSGVYAVKSLDTIDGSKKKSGTDFRQGEESKRENAERTPEQKVSADLEVRGSLETIPTPLRNKNNVESPRKRSLSLTKSPVTAMRKMMLGGAGVAVPQGAITSIPCRAHSSMNCEQKLCSEQQQQVASFSSGGRQEQVQSNPLPSAMAQKKPLGRSRSLPYHREPLEIDLHVPRAPIVTPRTESRRTSNPRRCTSNRKFTPFNSAPAAIFSDSEETKSEEHSIELERAVELIELPPKGPVKDVPSDVAGWVPAPIVSASPQNTIGCPSSVGASSGQLKSQGPLDIESLDCPLTLKALEVSRSMSESIVPPQVPTPQTDNLLRKLPAESHQKALQDLFSKMDVSNGDSRAADAGRTLSKYDLTAPKLIRVPTNATIPEPAQENELLKSESLDDKKLHIDATDSAFRENVAFDDHIAMKFAWESVSDRPTPDLPPGQQSSSCSAGSNTGGKRIRTDCVSELDRVTPVSVEEPHPQPASDDSLERRGGTETFTPDCHVHVPPPPPAVASREIEEQAIQLALRRQASSPSADATSSSEGRVDSGRGMSRRSISISDLEIGDRSGSYTDEKSGSAETSQPEKEQSPPLEAAMPHSSGSSPDLPDPERQPQVRQLKDMNPQEVKRIFDVEIDVDVLTSQEMNIARLVARQELQQRGRSTRPCCVRSRTSQSVRLASSCRRSLRRARARATMIL